MRRLKLKNYSMGANGRMFNIGILSGTTPEDSHLFMDTGVFGGPQSGTIYTTPVNTPHDIVSGGPIWRLDCFKRDYTINLDYDNIITGDDGLGVLGPSGALQPENVPVSSLPGFAYLSAYVSGDYVTGGLPPWFPNISGTLPVYPRGPSGVFSPVFDFQQLGDLTFNLTSETRLGNQWRPNLDDGMGNFYNDFYEPFPEVSDPNEWDYGDHALAMYYPSGEVTAEFPCLSTEVDRLVKNLTVNFRREPVVYGVNKVPLGKTENEIHIFAKETPSDNYDENHKWPFSGLVYGQADYNHGKLPFNYILEQDMGYDIRYVDDRWDNNDEVHYVNAFKCKNMYNNNWNTEIQDRALLEGTRNYLGIGETQNTLWLRYKYIRDYDYYQGETPEPGREEFAITPSQRYDLIERIKGLYKYQGYPLRKPNVFSVEIKNSSLLEAVSGDFKINGQIVLTESEVKEEIKGLIKEEITEMMKKITPSATQLWKIEWKGENQL